MGLEIFAAALALRALRVAASSRPPTAWHLLVGPLVPVGGLVGFSPPDFTPFVAFHGRGEKRATCRKPLKTKGRNACSGPQIGSGGWI